MAQLPDQGHIFKRMTPHVPAGVVTSWLLAIAVLALIGVVYLAQASQAAEEGTQLQITEQRLGELQRANTQLAAELAAAQQPERLLQRADQLGYRPAKPDEIDYVVVTAYPTPLPSPPPSGGAGGGQGAGGGP